VTFRTRVLLAAAPVALLPLLVFGFGVRRAVTERLAAEYGRRVAALAAVIREDLARQDRLVAERLATVRTAALDDDRLRLALRGVTAERPYLLDYAGRAMRAAGLDLLVLQAEDGRILSSGHFRNEFDREDPALPALLRRSPGGGALVRARGPDGPFLALARLDTVPHGDRWLPLVGGLAADSSFFTRLARDTALRVRLVLPGDVTGAAPGDDVVATIPLTFVDPAEPVPLAARVEILRAGGALAALRREVGAWFLISVLATAGAAVLLAGWLASRAARPLADVERRAALGDLARQVNHDVKNGLAPLRNVLRHLSEVAAREPADLARVYAERRGTLESSLAYLETLAANYARLYPRDAPVPTDVNAVVAETLGRVGGGGGGGGAGASARITSQLADGLPPLRIDPLALRRILENLVGNAVDSLEGKAGTVTISTARADGGASGVRLTVADTGKGMTRDELDRAFADFQSTKPGGTGLGLSIVRRLVMDAGGALRVETEPGVGSRFIVDLPT
jgi:signal transduction histidine kinase